MEESEKLPRVVTRWYHDLAAVSILLAGSLSIIALGTFVFFKLG